MAASDLSRISGDPRPVHGRKLAYTTIGFAILTVVTAPFAYGAPLLVTVPVLSALLANLYVRPLDGWSAVLATLLGPAAVIGALVFALRADEVLSDGVIAATITIAAFSGLIALRRRSRSSRRRSA